MSTTPAFVAIGDLHLSKKIWNRLQLVTGDAYHGLRESVDAAIDLNIPLVLLGDVFDSIEPDPDVCRAFRAQMDRCRDAQIAVYAIQGNHDKRPTPWYVALHDHPIHVGDGKPVVIAGFTVVGFDYAPADVIKQQLEGVEADILLLHQAARQYLAFEGAWNFDLDWVHPSTRLVLLGDIHAEVNMTAETGVPGYYTGATHPRDISQIGPKSVIVVNSDATITRRPIQSRPILRQVIAKPEDLEAVKQWIDEKLSTSTILPPLVWLLYQPDVAHLVIGFNSNAPAEIIVYTELLTPASASAAASAEDVVEAPAISVRDMIRQLLPEQDENMENYILSLLDPCVEFEETFARYRDLVTKDTV